MDSNRKRRGFIKGKLAAPFYKTSKSVSTASYLTKAAPTVHQDHLTLTPHHQQKHKLSFMIPDKGVDTTLVHYDMLFGTAGDEAVDMKAAKYISTVQERFKLERVNSGRFACEEVP
ncbi:hypothetical protein MLD38_000293 [Melastoma candidum]|uniref:Uncharacterized protein n=1 Tax=Melastoma candidum TaxID=119954 RepID=A0ACB9SI80_9MYRT|nr:hypothetical protein MLD38_000293 [Melastoma candidum]